MSSRRQAAFIVARWIATHEYPAEMLPQGADRAFVQDLVYTTVRRFRPLRAILGQLVAKWPKGELEALLLVGAAQILYMSDVPDFAAVNETVVAAKCCANKSIAKVVNGVLRNLIRRRTEFEAQLAAAPLAERESYPNQLVKRWVARYGEAGAAALAQWHNAPAETFLAYPPATRLEPSPSSADGLNGPFVRLPRGQRVEDVPGYAEGAFIVQDPATALAVELLDVRPGLSVLDFCAAPGGKTVQIAWRLGNGERGTGNGEWGTFAPCRAGGESRSVASPACELGPPPFGLGGNHRLGRRWPRGARPVRSRAGRCPLFQHGRVASPSRCALALDGGTAEIAHGAAGRHLVRCRRACGAGRASRLFHLLERAGGEWRARRGVPRGPSRFHRRIAPRVDSP